MAILRIAIGLICLGAIIISFLDIVPGDEIIVTAVLGPVALWGLAGLTKEQ